MSALCVQSVGGSWPAATAPPVMEYAAGAPPVPGLRCVGDIPADTWQPTSERRDCCHILGGVYVNGRAWLTLFDGGAISRSCRGSAIIAIVNHALHQGKTPADAEWPIDGLLRWAKIQQRPRLQVLASFVCEVWWTSA